MKTFASTSTLLLVCLGCGVMSLGFGSCDGSESSGGSAVLLDSGAAKDTGARRDSSTAPDSASAIDSSLPDVGAPDEGEDAGVDAGSCGTPETSLGTACDECIATSCEATWCACAADPVVVGDAGTGCQSYVQCVESCVATDAGSPTDCLLEVCAVPPFTQAEQKAGHSFLDCLVQYCGSACGQ